jgi:hypothetical protein
LSAARSSESSSSLWCSGNHTNQYPDKSGPYSQNGLKNSHFTLLCVAFKSMISEHQNNIWLPGAIL